jgi:IS30 family transposase
MARIYFVKPHKSCGKGLNWHLNGMIRQYLPKNYDFKYVVDKGIREIQNQIDPLFLIILPPNGQCRF